MVRSGVPFGELDRSVIELFHRKRVGFVDERFDGTKVHAMGQHMAGVVKQRAFTPSGQRLHLGCRMKPDLVAPEGFSLVHRRIGLHEDGFLSHRFATKHHHPDTRRAAVFNT